MSEPITQQEQIRAGMENFIGGPVTDEEIAHLARTAPAQFHLVSQQGQFGDNRMVTDKFLGTLPEELFDYLLVGAMAFFRRGQSMTIETLLSSELCALALRLAIAERNDRDIERTDEDYVALMDRFSRLILLKEQRRAGAFVWINRYSLLNRVTDEFPLRLPVVDRRTEH